MDFSAGTADERMIAQHSIVVSFTLGFDGRLVDFNARLADALCVSSATSLLGRPIVELMAGARDWVAWRQAIVAGGERNTRIVLRAMDGRSVSLRGDLQPMPPEDASSSSGPTYFRGIFVDVTEEENLRRAVQHSAHMEALGSLTSGVAHDFNNLLTVLVGNLYLVAEELRDQPESFGKLKSARDAASRGAGLIRQLLSFARRETLHAGVVDVTKIIADLVPLLERALRSRIRLTTNICCDSAWIRCNAAQLESVIVNLVVNARDAIEGDGSIVLSVESAAGFGRRTDGPGEGDCLNLKVTDDGAGIGSEMLGRVFEPFFTTKGERGTGLGLSMVRWFAEQAGGAVDIDSSPGRGTAVSLLLPRAPDETAETSTRTAPLSTLPSGNEKVLVVAAEEGLQSTIKQILDVLGYEVHLGGDAAVALMTIRTRRIDLLLLDADAMHSTAQQRLVRQAFAANSQLKLIVTANAADLKRVRVPDGAAVLSKPFSLKDLADTLRSVLGGGSH